MIYDDTAHGALYYSLDPRIERAFAFYRDFDPATPSGRRDLDGDNFFVLVQRPDKRPLADAAYEIHQRHVDLQIVVAGSEAMGVALVRPDSAYLGPYDPDADVRFFRADDGAVLLGRAGQFYLFLPQDGHAPCCDDGRGGGLVKLTFKLRL